jgi:hypothetical protein
MAMQRLRSFAVGVAMLIGAMATLPGCATVNREEVASWRQAVVATRDQSAVTFRAVNELVRDSQMKRAERLTALKESDFSAGLEGDAIRRWNAALDSMAVYAAAVEQLLAPELPRDVGASLKKTGEQLSSTADLPLLKANGAVSTAIGAIGTKLVAMAANSRARDIMLATDGDVKDLTEAMAAIVYSEKADADGETIASGIAVTVAGTWDQRLAEIEVEFANLAANASGEAKRAMARRYAEQIAGKQAAMDAVMGLRRTLLDLGPAHTAAAQGRTASLEGVITSAREQMLAVAAVIQQIQAERAAAK